MATLGFWPVSVEMTSCLSSNTSSDMYFLLESPLLSPELGTTSFSLLSQHACSARENSRKDEECSEYSHYPLPRWRNRMCRVEKHKRSQIGLRSTKSSVSTVWLRFSPSCLAKTNKCPHSSCHKWCTKPCSPPISQFGDMDKVHKSFRYMGLIKIAFGTLCSNVIIHSIASGDILGMTNETFLFFFFSSKMNEVWNYFCSSFTKTVMVQNNNDE